MMNVDRDTNFNTSQDDEPPSPVVRDIHPLTPTPPAATGPSSSPLSSVGENFTTISREFNALVVAGSMFRTENETNLNLREIEEESGNSSSMREEMNPLAIVAVQQEGNPGGGGLQLQVVKKEEAESKISAWQKAKIAKANNRYKREEAVIKGWESEKVQEATSKMKKVERKLEEKRAKALEKMQNMVAKAHRKAEERRASAEARRGIKVGKVMEIVSLMRAVGTPHPPKRSFF